MQHSRLERLKASFWLLPEAQLFDGWSAIDRLGCEIGSSLRQADTLDLIGTYITASCGNPTR